MSKGLRTGWTTGTCASAAAKAATIGLVTGNAPTEVEVGLPGQRLAAVADVSDQPATYLATVIVPPAK